MSEALSRARCFNHEYREAAARCPECEHFYCRECVTEHEGRVLCVRCLSKLHTPANAAPQRLPWLVLCAQGSAALLLLWFVFFTLADGLAHLPDTFHEEAPLVDSGSAEGEI